MKASPSPSPTPSDAATTASSCSPICRSQVWTGCRCKARLDDIGAAMSATADYAAGLIVSRATASLAEALGTALLLAIVIGSGIMGERLAGRKRGDRPSRQHAGDRRGPGRSDHVFGPLSGAHFNPAVTLVFALRREIGRPCGAAYVAAQIAGAIAGRLGGARRCSRMPLLQVSDQAARRSRAGSRSSSRPSD